MDPHLDRLRRALAPDYLLERELGRGGMGVVYLAHDVKLACPVAIKILAHPEIEAVSTLARFKREAQILAQLRHPNIVPVHSVGEADGLPYYVMDYVAAETLATRLLRGPLSPNEALRLGRDLLSGLGFAHQKGFLHRDIKPSNIFLEEHRAILGDFGIARSSNPGDVTLTEQGGVLGTPGYMSPEQASAGDVREPSDLYAVGIVLYESSSGSRLGELTPPEKIGWSGVPDRLRPVLERALEWDAKDRWPNAPAFKTALEDAGMRLGLKRPLVLITLAALAVVAVIVGLRTPDRCDARRDFYDLAILPFTASGEPDGSVMAELIQANLLWFNRLKLSPPDCVAGFLNRRAPGDSPPRALHAALTAEGLVIRRSPGSLLRLTVRDSTPTPRDAFEVTGDQGDVLSWARAAADSMVRREFPLYLEEYRKLGGAGNPSNSIAAYRHYFAGERAFQRDAYRTALAQYDSALALDSSFIWASWRIAIVRRFLRQPFEENLKQLYQARGGELPGQYRGLIEALLEPDLTRRFARYRQVVNAYPRDGYVRFVYADELFHRGPLAGIPLDSALAQFRETVRIEPYLEQMPSWDHLFYGYIRLGRRAAADSALAHRLHIPFSGEDEDRRRRRFFKLAYDERFQPWLANLKEIAIRFGSDSTLLEGMQRYVRLGLSFDIPDAQVGLGRILVTRGTLAYAKANGHQARGMALLFLGRPMAALPQLDSAAALFGRPDSLLERAEWRVLPGALGLPGIDSSEVAWGIGVLRGLIGDSTLSPRAAWALAIDAHARGDSSEARSWALPLERRSVTDSGAARLAALLNAIREGEGGAVDSALLSSEPLLVYRTEAGVQDPFSRSVLYLYRVRWFLAQGDSIRADRARLWYQNSDNGLEGWPQHELEAGEVDEMMGVYARLLQAEADLARGRKNTACPLVSRVLELWTGAESGLDPLKRRAEQVVAGCRQ